MHFWNIFLIFVLSAFCQFSGTASQYIPGYKTGGSSQDNIHLGFISDSTDENVAKIFEYAIDVANEDLAINIEGHIEQINYGDSLNGYNSLCQLMQNGVGAVFAPSAKYTAVHLMSVCDAKDVPYIYAHMRENVDSFNLHPHPKDLANVLHAIISEFSWERFIFLYESSEYLSILNELMSIYGSNAPTIIVLRYDLKLNGNYKAVLRRIRKSEDSQIVVVGSTPSIAELLRQAQQVGIVNDDYMYIIGNLDLHTFDLEEYKFSDANITGLRMFSPEQPEVKNLITQLGDFDFEAHENDGYCPITIEMAMIYDAVQVIAETLENLPYHPQPLNCSEQSEIVQNDGSTFKNYMRSLDITENILTGRIYFEGNIRKGYTFDIVELQNTGLVKVGTWEERKNFTFERPNIPIETTFDISEDSLVNKTFRVLIYVPNQPYASLIVSHKKLEGNDQYEGFSIDVIKELAERLGFNYTFKNGGNDYGSYNKTTNVTTGMLKEIREGRADLAITDLTITSERQDVCDFTIPFMNLGISILYVQPRKAEPKLFTFMSPFAGEVWMYVGIAFLGVSLSFFVLGRLSPMEWDNPYPCIEEPEELENQFTVNNSFWFTTGAILQQGSEIAPKALSTRILASMWWFFTLIMVSSYTANLAAFLTIENRVSLIEDVEDLANNKGGVQYGAKRTGSTRNFFLTSDHEVYKKMNEYLLNHKEMLTETNDEGVQRVNATYAFLMESTSIEFNTMRKCELMKVGNQLDEKGYGIAMKKDSPYRDKINSALLELQEQGILATLKNKWWKEVGAGVCNKKTEGGAAKLGWPNLGGIFYVLCYGSAFSTIFGIILWFRNVLKKAKYYEVSFGKAFIQEFIIVMNVKNNERILKGATSVYSRSRTSLNSIDSLATDSNESDDDEQSNES